MSETEKNAPPIADEIAIISKDIDVTEGFFLENPDTTILTESKGKGLKLYDEIDRDAHAGSVLQTRYLSVAGEKWEVDPGDDSPRGKEIAEFITNALTNCNLLQAVQELMQAILYGYYVGEVIWKEMDKAILPAKILVKHPRRFGFTAERDLRLLTRKDPKEGEAVPDRKFLVLTFGASDNPYGKGLGQRLWWPVWFKKHGIKFWLIFLDKFGMPTVVGKYPSGAKEEEKKTLMEAAKAIHSETGITIPDSMMIELLEASRGGKVSYDGLCEYMDLQISKAVLGQTLTTEVKGGSFAASKTHDDVRHDIKEADAGLVASVLNSTLIKWLVDFNFSDVSDYPVFRYITEKEQVLKDLAERDEILVNRIGVKVDPDYFYGTFNLPRPEGGGEVIRPQVSQGGTPEFSEVERGTEKNKKFTPEQQALEDLADSSIATDLLATNEKKILQIVQDSDSYEEAMENLLAFYPEMNVDSLQANLENSIINSQLLGKKVIQDGDR